MTIDEIFDYINGEIGDEGNTKISKLRKMAVINRMYFKIVNEINGMEIDYFSGNTTYTAAITGQNLPADFISAKDLSIDGTPIEFIIPQQRHIYDPTSVLNWLDYSGTYYAFLRGKQIFFSNAVSGTATLYYYRHPPKLHRGMAQAGSLTEITLADEAMLGTVETTDDYYNNGWIITLAGTGSGQTKQVTDYVGSTKVASVAFDVAPDETTVYETLVETPDEYNLNLILCDLVVARLGGDKNLKAEALNDLQTALFHLCDRQGQNAYGVT